MTTLETIEQEILTLSAKEKAKLREWFAELEAQLWDEQIERDAKAGKLDKLPERARAAHKAGRTPEI
jgi:hypothetical protein